MKAKLSRLLSTIGTDEHDNNLFKCDLVEKIIRHRVGFVTIYVDGMEIQYYDKKITVRVEGIIYNMDSISIKTLTDIIKALFPETN